MIDNHEFSILFDEFSANKDYSVTDLVYSLANGKDRSRLNKECEERITGDFQTTIISTGEASISQKDYSISELAGMLREGDIKTNPDYQREYIYDDKKASALVESILMGIPIPVIYLSEEKDYSYEVIDGQQRILSFVKYFNNEFPLKLDEQSALYELNGKNSRI